MRGTKCLRLDPFEGPDPLDLACRWAMFTDGWCYAEESEFRYHMEADVFQHLSDGHFKAYDADSDSFVDGTMQRDPDTGVANFVAIRMHAGDARS